MRAGKPPGSVHCCTVGTAGGEAAGKNPEGGGKKK